MSLDPRSIVDDALEISVVGSFSRIGPVVRRRLFRWTPAPAGTLAGRTVLVTGPTSGLGRAAAGALAALGARVVLAGRSEERLARLRDELVLLHGEDRFPIVVVDMGSLASVRAAAARVAATEPRLDVVVDNAGAIYPERTEGPDGSEATLTILALAPFVLVAELLPLLRRTAGSRVIAVTSGGIYAQRLDLGDLQYRSGEYNGTLAYARAKRAQVALMREWDRRLSGSGIAFAAMHPGWADTPGLADSLPAFHRVMRPLLRTPAEGVDTITWLATHPEPDDVSGRLYLDRRPRPFDRVPATRLTAADRRRLWDLVVALTGGCDPAPAATRPGPDGSSRRRPASPDRRAQARRPTASATTRAASTTRVGRTSSLPLGSRSELAAAPPTATTRTCASNSRSTTRAAPSRSACMTTPTTAARARVRATTSSQPSTVTSWPR